MGVEMERAQAVPMEEAEQAAGTFGRLRPGSPVLRAALRILRGERLESIQPLHNSLKNVSPARWRERFAAAWTLGRAPLEAEESDAAAGTLMTVLENGFRERGRRKTVRWLARTYIGSFLFACAVAFVNRVFAEHPFYYVSPWWDSWEYTILLAAMIGTVTLFLSLPLQSLFEKRRNDFVRAAAARGLAHRGYVEAVGPLAGCLFDSSAEVRQACAEALHELLPQVSVSDYGALGADSMSKLGRALTESDGTLVAKTLDALEKVGTSHAIPHVEKLLKSTRSTLTRDRAQKVLDVLNERKLREAEGKGLLRPIASPQDGTTMLRPAQTAAEAEIEQLLRPSGENLN